MKPDAGFQQAQVLDGAGKVLCEIRDIVFEEIGPYPEERSSPCPTQPV
jgi:hypothetical protein